MELSITSVRDGLDICPICDAGEGSVTEYIYNDGAMHLKCHACGWSGGSTWSEEYPS